MTRAAFFIDLSNFYSRLLKSGVREPRFLRDYFLYWLDFDLLAKSLSESFSGIWIFYSDKRIGPSSERIEGTYLQKYIRRITALEGVTARNVNIPGEQREAVAYKCDQCNHEGLSEAISEKGIDASLTVHLFDTMDSWDKAYLLSGDADFVPAVSSLRRRGKIVIGVGFPDASYALVRECYDYANITDLYIRQDIVAYSLFKTDGIAQRWLSQELTVDVSQTSQSQEPIEVAVEWGIGGHMSSRGFTQYKPLSYHVSLEARGPIDRTNHRKLVEDLQTQLGSKVEVEQTKSGYRFALSPDVWRGVNRRLEDFTSSIQNVNINTRPISGGITCVKTYQFNEQTGQHEVASDNSIAG